MRKLTPACSPGRKPLDHSRAEIACTCSVFVGRATITTNVGRSSFSEPRPYDAHDPRHGRPVTWLPVCMNVIAGSWLIASVCMLRMNSTSSTVFFIHGNSSHTHMPRLAALLELELRRRDRKPRLPGGHRREPLAHADRSRAGPCRTTRRITGL